MRPPSGRTAVRADRHCHRRTSITTTSQSGTPSSCGVRALPLNTRDILSVTALTGLFTGVLLAQAPAPAVSAGRPPTAATEPDTTVPTPGKNLTATSAHVDGAGGKNQLLINRTPTHAGRRQLSAAWHT